MAPLAERMRPQALDQYVGQPHLVGPRAALRRAIDQGNVPSMILWGPPGVGKTTLARLIAQGTKRPFSTLSAIHSGVKDVREAIDRARGQKFFNSPPPILFIDEIHRFNKAQQDSLLGAVERGDIVLIGATTENPSFEVIPALLSRCQVYVLEALERQDLQALIERALREDAALRQLDVRIEEYEALLLYAGGDARKLLNLLELVLQSLEGPPPLRLDNAKVEAALQHNLLRYDKSGEQHYDIISAFIKSVRGSAPQAAVYWLARMIDGGEDVKFIARRLIILAAEDIGLANPNALLMANACFDAVHKIGLPEARIILSQATIYLACSAKSNSAYLAIDAALAELRESGQLPVPLHLRNAPSKLMKELGYGKGYQYAHDFPGHFVAQAFLPPELEGRHFFQPADNPAEQRLRQQLAHWWKDEYQ